MKISFLLLCSAVSIAFGEKSLHFMERSIFQKSFAFKERSLPQISHELIFLITYKSLPKLQSILDQVSDPYSKQYRNWLTSDHVRPLVHNPTGIMAVSQWLKEFGIEISRQSIHGEVIVATAPIGLWESLLNATFYNCHDSRRGRKVRRLHRSPEYWIPLHLKPYVSAVFNTVQIPPLVNSFHKSAYSIVDEIAGKTLQNPFPNSAAAVPVTIRFLNNLYNVDSNIGDPAVTQSVVETADESYSPADLQQFQRVYNLTQQKAININGHNISDCSSASNFCEGGNRDIQYIMGMAQATTSIYWYSSYESMDPFLLWIVTMADTKNPPSSNSISWGAPEQFISESTLEAFNQQALRLAVQGVTIIVASGVAAAGADCLCEQDSSSTAAWSGEGEWAGTGYFPSFPSTSPYVTAVGATMLPQIGSAEVGCQSDQGGVVSSGGGFSTYFAQPSWQQRSVDNYFAHLFLNQTPVAGYNRYGRGIPDVSLIGTNYEFITAGTKMYLFGTACSAPVFAGFVSLINAALKAANKNPVGFLNPTLYSNKSAAIFRDITTGNNKCCYFSSVCCSSGFTATKGWDPMTGLGSLDFSLFKSLYAKKVSAFNPTTTPTKPSVPTKSVRPTRMPTTSYPTTSPSLQLPPTATKRPTRGPTSKSIPTARPTTVPTATPSTRSTFRPSALPSRTIVPSTRPVQTIVPSTRPVPSTMPSKAFVPSTKPSNKPSTKPSNKSSTNPSNKPSTKPSIKPSTKPSGPPSTQSTKAPKK